MTALEVMLSENRQKKTTTDVFTLKKNLQRRLPVGKGGFKMSQFWVSCGEHLCGPEDIWKAVFDELQCLKKWLVLIVAPVVRLVLSLGYLLL